MTRTHRTLVRMLALTLAAAFVAGAALPAMAAPRRARAVPVAASAPATGTSFSFDSSSAGWSGIGASLSRVERPAHRGSGALRIVSSTTNRPIAALSGLDRASWTPVTAGTTQRVGGWTRPATVPRPVQPVLLFYDAAGAEVASRFGPVVTGTTGSWTALPAIEATAPLSATHLAVGVIVYDARQGEAHYLDTVSVRSLGIVPMTLGVYDVPTHLSADTARLRDMEAWQGKRHAVVMLYTNWDPGSEVELFDRLMPTVWNHGSVPMVSWMPWIGNDPAQDYNARIAAGAYDRYVRDWARRMKSWLSGPDRRYGTSDDRRAYLRLAHEANGNWYPYSPAWGAGTADSYVRMWRRVHDIFRSTGIDRTRLAWVWSVFNDDADPTVPAEALYPGDAYVDWVGVDGYNWGNLHEPMESWETPSEVFDPIVDRLRALTTRPLGVNEVGATVHGFGTEAVSRWIDEYFAWARSRTVRMSMWFNDYPDVWMVFGGLHGDATYEGASGTYRVFSAYRSAVAAADVKGPSAGNRRLITDAEFLGT